MGINQLPSISTNLSSFLAYQLFCRVRGHTIFLERVCSLHSNTAKLGILQKQPLSLLIKRFLQHGPISKWAQDNMVNNFLRPSRGKVLALPFQLGKVEEKVVHTSTLLLLLRPFTMSLSEKEIPTHLSSRVLHVMLEIP